jgi:hypothetical protein
MNVADSFNKHDFKLWLSCIGVVLSLGVTLLLWGLCCHAGAEVHKHILIPGSVLACSLGGCILFAA